MKVSEEITYKTGWIAAFALLAGLFIWAVSANSTLREIACAPLEANCYRDWISALGGWAAVVAAVPTVYFLYNQNKQAQDQFSDAQTQHRDRLIIDLRHSLALAKYARNEADTVGTIIHFYEMADHNYTGPLPLGEVSKQVNGILKMLASPCFDRLESEIEYPNTPNAQFVRALANGINERNLTHFQDETSMSNEARNRLDDDFHRLRVNTLEYVEAVFEIADRHIDQCQKMISRYATS
jgi:hypothetical protein